MHTSRFLGLLAAVCIFSTQGFCEQTVTYQSKTSGKSKKVEWSLSKNDEGVLLNGKTKGSDIEIELSPEFTFLTYSEKTEPRRNFEIKRDGPCLILEGKRQGNDVLKSYRIGKDRWIQDFNFGLRPFLEGNDKRVTFHLISPKDFDIHEFVAIKELDEVVKIGDKKYNTQKVKITLTGFKKNFWKAQVWFDKESHLLVRYRANEGPGTPYTETTLQEVKKSFFH